MQCRGVVLFGHSSTRSTSLYQNSSYSIYRCQAGRAEDPRRVHVMESLGTLTAVAHAYTGTLLVVAGVGIITYLFVSVKSLQPCLHIFTFRNTQPSPPPQPFKPIFCSAKIQCMNIGIGLIGKRELFNGYE